MRNLTAETDHKTPFDFIFILGPGHDAEPIIEKLTEFKNAGKKVAIITESTDYEIIENAIGSRTRIDILAHGGRTFNKKEHFVQIPVLPFLPEGALTQDKFISTDLFFTYLTHRFIGNNSLDGLQIHLWSCFGGRAIHAVKHLPLGATLITHGPADTFTINTLIYNNALSSLSRYCLDSFEEFSHVIMESADEVAIAQVRENGVLVYRAPVTQSALSSFSEISSHINEKLINYYAVLKKFGIDFTEKNIRMPTEDQLTEYGEEAAYIHASLSNDTTYIRTYLAKKEKHPANFSYEGDNLPYIAAQRMARNANIPELWDYLIENKVDLNMPSQDKAQPFEVFITQKKLEGINFLLSQHVDVNYRMRESRTPLICAAFKKSIFITKRLLQEKNILIDAQDEDGFSALILASYVGELTIVNMLLQAGADPALRIKVGATALLVAAQNGFPLVVKRLLQHQSGIKTINWATDNNWTAIWLAAQNGHVSVVNFLLKNKAHSNITCNDDHSTPLQAALKNNHIQIVQLFLQHKQAQLTTTIFDNLVQLSLPPIEIKNTNDSWLCEHLNTDALLCMKNEFVRHLTKLPKTSESWDYLEKTGDTFICTPLPNKNQAMHCVGEKMEYLEWSLQSELKTESHESLNTSPSVLMTLGGATISGAAHAVLPEAIGDLFLLLNFLTEANSQRLKFLINVTLIMMTGSWLGALVAMTISNLFQKTGYSEQSAKISGNTAAFFVNAGLEMTPIGIAAAVVNYGAGRLGLFAEKQVVNKLRGMTEGDVDANKPVIDF